MRLNNAAAQPYPFALSIAIVELYTIWSDVFAEVGFILQRKPPIQLLTSLSLFCFSLLLLFCVSLLPISRACSVTYFYITCLICLGAT
ncbi:hypothetical protein BDZ45DRAFT_148049 [Acephala macrosclerotiorum]|nr:hypothetical protein BDZ45DRAFT_148049 [Acephala macrosclerotiorum]